MAGRPKRAEDLARLDLDVGLQDRVWDMLEGGVGYSQICIDLGVTKAALLEWLELDANAERASRARARAAEALVGESLEIADKSGDPRLQITQRNWTAERWNRARYGQQTKVEVSGRVEHLHLGALQHRKPALPQVDVVAAQAIDVEPKTLEQQLAEL